MKIRLLLFCCLLIHTRIHAQWSTFCSGNTDGFVVDFAKYNDTIFRDPSQTYLGIIGDDISLKSQM